MTRYAIFETLTIWRVDLFDRTARRCRAWPRGKGKAFTSSSASSTWPDGRAFKYPDVYGSGYTEFGISARFTLGFDLGSSDSTRPDRLKVVGFIRYTLTDPQSRHQFALDFGGGTYLGQGVVRLGASYGTGLQMGNRSGWLSVETNMLKGMKTQQITHSIDATLGLNLERSKLIRLLSIHRAATGQSTFSFTPSYAHELKGGRHVEIGVTVDLDGALNPALKLGIWQEF